MLHYHIRWSSKELVDWEAHRSRAEAEASANRLVRPGETYTIEERDESCPRCWKSFNVKSMDTNPNRSYSWQQTVLDAVNERDSQRRIGKINAAQRAISARLVDRTPPDLDEHAALQDALRTLRTLLPKRKEKPGSEQESA